MFGFLKYVARSVTRPATRRPAQRTRPALETLEDRLTPSVTIQLDYSYDTNNFFRGHPDRQQVLQTAADTLGARLGDALAAITPNAAAGNNWDLAFLNPSNTGQQVTLHNETIPANTIRLYVGGEAMSGGNGEVGYGGYGGDPSVGGTTAFMNAALVRGKLGGLGSNSQQTDFGRWGGNVSFDSSFAGWYFGLDANGIAPNQTDFFTVAEHEISHALGFGTAPSWENRVSGSSFTGPASVKEYGGAVPVDAAAPNAGHLAHGTLDHGSHVTMDPIMTNGIRTAFTPLDWAGLQDLGWHVTPAPVPPPAPTLTGPTGASAGQAPTFTWTASTGATSYQLQVDGQTVQSAASITQTAFTLSTPLAAGTHTARVQASSASTQLSSGWGPLYTFTVASGVPQAPTGLALTGAATDAAPVGFRWNASAGATGYELIVAAPGQPKFRDVTVSGPFSAATVSATVATLPASTYTVSVVASNASGSSTPSQATFTVTASAPGAPTNLTVDSTVTGKIPTFRWQGSPAAAGFEAQLDNSQTVAVQATSWTAPTRLAAGVHTVSIRAVGGNGAKSAFTTLQFSVSSSVPQVPQGLTQAGAVTDADQAVFTWNASPGATGYVVTVNAPGVGPFTIPASLNGAAVSVTLPVLSAGSYTVTVVATNDFGESSAPAQATLTVTSSAPQTPAAPTGLSVVAGTATAAPTFSWQASAGATSYELIVTTADGSDTPLDVVLALTDVTVVNGMVTYTPANALYPADFTFTVTAFNDPNGTSSDPSAPLAFTVASFTPAAPTGLMIVGGTASAAPTFSWQASTGATSYELIVTTADGSDTPLDIVLSLSDVTVVNGTVTYTPANALYSADFTFNVVAFNDPSGTSSDGSAAFAFTVA